MKPDERKAFVQDRIRTAYETLDAGKLLAENGFWNSAVNRLYYSIFYAVNALLFHSGLIIHSHSGLKSQFSRYFIKTGKRDKKYGRLLAELYDWRQKGDYENYSEFNAESVKPVFEQVSEMIEQIEKELKKSDG